MDFVTDLPLCKDYNTVFTVVDKFTKFYRFVPCYLGDGELTAQQVAQLFFDNIVKTFELPQLVLHDRDAHFTAYFQRKLWRLYGIRAALTSAYHPQSDWQTEHQHRTLEYIIRCMLAEHSVIQSLWCGLLLSVKLAIKSTIQDSTGFMPNYLEFGTQFSTPLDVVVGNESNVPAVGKFLVSVSRAVQDAHAQMKKAVQYQCRYIDKHRKDINVKVGDQVLMDSRHLRISGSSKFHVHFVGPFPIVEWIGVVVYHLELPPSFRNLHYIFYISLFCHFTARGDGSAPPEPVVGDTGDLEYEIQDLLGHRKRHRHLQYLIRFVGYGPSHYKWLSADELYRAAEKLRKYWEAAGLSP